MSDARLAATVVVLRPTTAAPEILLVRRARGASFMADAFVFPGGRVDAADGEGDVALRRAAARELAEEAAVIIDSDALVPFARWITPSAEPKRFDATFFVGVVAAGTEAKVDSAEVTEHVWASAVDILARHERGGMLLPPPTLRTVEELSPLPSIAAIVSWARLRPLDPIMPKLLVEPHATILLPWDADYARAPGEGRTVSPQLAGGATRYVFRDRRFVSA